MFRDLTVDGNNNYYCSEDKKSCMAVAHNTRKGAISTYIEPWSLDVIDFLDLRKNSGEERRRAHDLFPALWIPDLFMERVLKNEMWTLFDPKEVPELVESYGDEFERIYSSYEQRNDIRKMRLDAKGLWKIILRSYFETGLPFLSFKDEANRRNPQKHKGMIRSSNLCTEIFQNTSSGSYKVLLKYRDGSFGEVDDKVKILTIGSTQSKRTDRLSLGDFIIEDKSIEQKIAETVAFIIGTEYE